VLHNTLKLSDLTTRFHTVVNSIHMTCKNFKWKILYVYPYGRIKFHVTLCNSVSENALIYIANIFLDAVILVCVMKEIIFEKFYTLFKGILLHVN
jgi:hypothetical protein